MNRPPARVITTVWGESYLADLLKLALPAILAPGNLPALASACDTEFVIVTEEALFPFIEGHPVFKRIREICPARLIANDDLVISRQMYGMSLTYSLHRGFEDLGERMTEHNLVFFNSDFILADGSWRSLAKEILAGERLIFSPSYCAITEDVVPLLLDRVEGESQTLSLQPREMARLILDHRHDCIRAKTVNRQSFHMNISDQFYWEVDDGTLLGHQLPISLVCMRPQKVHMEPESFWDYATISCACPTANRCVLGDSDDFLMLELRSRSTYSDLMIPGPVSQQEVANGIGQYMTADQFEMGRHALTLHRAEIPAGALEARRALASYVDGVYSLLPPEPKDYVNHQYWRHSIDEFRKLKAEWWEKRGQLRNIATRGETAQSQPKHHPLRNIYDWIFGILPRVTPWHPYWTKLRFAVGTIEREIRLRDARAVIVAPESSVLARMIREAPCLSNHISADSLLKYNMPQDARDISLCLCDLDWEEFSRFPEMYQFIRPRMRRSGRVVVYHSGRRLRYLRRSDFGTIARLIPTTDATSLRFSGSWLSLLVCDALEVGLKVLHGVSRGRSILLALLLFSLAVPARFAAWRERRRHASKMPSRCSAITFDIEIT